MSANDDARRRHMLLNQTRPCPCGSDKPRYSLVDARGIFCCYVCEDCEEEKRSHYRPEIFEDANYAADEPIEEED